MLFAVILYPFNEYFCKSFILSVQEWGTLFFSDMSILVTIGENSVQQQFYLLMCTVHFLFMQPFK